MRLYQEVGGQLRDAIYAGKHQLGERLPPERDIAEQFGVSRSVVREALIMLELEKLVEVRKGSGVYVINCPTELPSDGSATPYDSGFGPFELLQARQLLESEVAAFAATQATKADIVKMRQAIDQERNALEQGIYDDSGDEQFHCLLAQSTQNSVLANMVSEAWQARKQSPMWEAVHLHAKDYSYRWQWLEDHQRILQAVLRRDAKAAKQAMWQHLENVKSKLLAISDADDPAFDGFLFESVPTVLDE
jgi:GntR family uxuAB operon transcriptional repressor